MKVIIGVLIAVSVAIGFSRSLSDYLPLVVLASTIVVGWIALTGNRGPTGPWPHDDIRSGRSSVDNDRNEPF